MNGTVILTVNASVTLWLHITMLNETFIKNGANIRHSKCKNGYGGKNKGLR